MPKALVNGDITASEVDLFDENGAALGVKSRETALTLARARGFDLVQDGMFSSPPRCRLVVPGGTQQAEARAARIAAGGPSKEMRLTTAMGAHDVDVKKRQTGDLLDKGYSVKLTVRLTKQERASPAAARNLLDILSRELAGQGSPVGKPHGESGALVLLLEPRDA